MASTHSVVMVALLPIPIKNCNIPQKRLNEQREANWEMMNEVLRRALHRITFKQNASAESANYKVLCADGNFRRCKPVLAEWLADCPQYSDLHHCERHVCFWWECSKNEVGDYDLPDKQHPGRDHHIYRILSDAINKAANAQLLLCHVDQTFKLFGHIPWIVSDLPKPDLLHSMQISMLDHFQKLIFHCMKTHKLLNKYNVIWLSVPAYHNLTPKTKS